MFCKNCGKELKDDSRFCDGCGTELQKASQPTNPQASLQPQVKSQQQETQNQPMYQNSDLTAVNSDGISEKVLAEMVGKNESYYLNAFRIVTANGKKFNWAVFWIGPIVLFYRKMYLLFLKTFFPIIIIASIASITSVAAASSFNLGLLAFGGILSFVDAVAMIVVSILTAKSFNKKYYEKFKQIIFTNKITDSNFYDLPNRTIVKKQTGVSGIAVVLLLACAIVTTSVLFFTKEMIVDANLGNIGSEYVANSEQNVSSMNELRVDLAKTATPEEYPDKTYGEAFDSFFSNPQWNTFVSDNATYGVEFKGEASYEEKDVSVMVQFTIDEEDFMYKPTYMEIDDVFQKPEAFKNIIATIFES